MVRCQRYIEIIEAEGLIENAARVGAHLLDGLRGLEGRFPGHVTNARGRGMFLAIDLPDGELRRQALAAFNQADVLGLASGERAVRFRPPVSLTEAEADEALRRVEKALHSVLG
jgi:L-lysine 6-transaminase